MSKPEPLTPPDCDLRGLPFMQLDVSRLVDSDMFALSTGEEFKAAVALWCKSWLQIPASSLPNDDRVLAHLSGAGSRWGRIKEMALRGWVLCSDGRLYHPTVAEKARHAWESRVRQRERAAKRWDKSDRKPGNATASDSQEPRECHGISHGNALLIERENTPIVPTGDEPTLELETEDANSGNETEGPARDFEAFWSAYPRKDGKASARKAYDRARRKIGHEAIMRAVSAWPFGENVRNGQDFRPHPASWLNGERWNDESVIHATAKPIASQYPPEVEAAHKAAKREWARTGCQGPPPMIQDFSEGARA